MEKTISIIQWEMSKSTNVIFYISDFRSGTTCAHESNTHTETDKPKPTGEIL